MATATASGVDELHPGREGDEGENGGAVRAIETALAGLFAAPRKLAGRRWHGRVCAHGEHALGVLLARWRRRLASASWAGPHSAGPQLGRLVTGERQVSFSVFLFFFLFSIYLLCFDLVKILNHFQNS